MQHDGTATDFRVGTGTGEARISSDGTYDLILHTNDGTNSGSITITDGTDGDIAIAPNGTGAVEINGAYKLPTAVTGSNDYVLTAQTDGSTAWAAAGGGGGTPGGSDTEIQYNDGGAFGGNAAMTFDDTSGDEQVLVSASSTVAPLKVVQTGAGNAFEVFDQAGDTTAFAIRNDGKVGINTTPSGG